MEFLAFLTENDHKTAFAHAPQRLKSVGRIVPNVQVKITAEGEVSVKARQAMLGYGASESVQTRVGDDDWFDTGDMGYFDDEGFLYLQDRKKDMINVSGFNVYPNEIENVLADHEKVLEVAVVGVPHEKSTECVKAFIVKGDLSLTEEEVHNYCTENLAGYKRPKFVEFRDELPKSNVGKILRRLLKEEVK